jgi:Tfp pilus assembly protein PilN
MSPQEINLLPPERRRLVRNESIAVSIINIVKSMNAGLLLMTVLALVMVGAVWLYSWAATPTTQEELNQAVDQYQTLRDRIAQENVVLERLEEVGQKRIAWSEMLIDFFATTPPGVTLSRLGGDVVFADGVVASGTLNFAGQAATRNALTIYEERLRSLPGVRQVNSPTSNLLERTNPLFQFTLTVAPPGE